MNLRCIAVLGLGIVLLAMVVELVRVSKEHSPTVNGLPISKWLRSPRSYELGAVAQAGTNAIPVLARLVRAHDVIPFQWSMRIWNVLPRSLRLKVRPPVAASDLRREALLALRGFGPEAQPALGVVIEAATKDSDIMNWSFARQAAVAINANDPRVLALLEQDLRSSHPVTRSSPLAALCYAATFPRPLTNLIALDPHDRNQVLFSELLALGTLGPDVAPFVPRIVPFLSDDSTRMNALTALQRAGPGAAAAVPALIVCLRVPEGRSRRSS